MKSSVILPLLMVWWFHHSSSVLMVTAKKAPFAKSSPIIKNNIITKEEEEQQQVCEISKPRTSKPYLQELYNKYTHQPTFLQAVEEMATSLESLFQDPQRGNFYKKAFLIMVEPERVINFRVPWVDDNGVLQINRGWRIEFSSVLGPYKGGLRFHPSVDEGVLKFLGFEQIFKNALTGLPLGGGKGGSDFDPKGKSSNEVQRFCDSFMTELYRYIHPSTDVPAGDIGVGGRELGYLIGQYKRITNRHGEGVLTGKPLNVGGSLLRPEATGYGLAYIANIAITKQSSSTSTSRTLNGAKCLISGSGNVAQYAAEKLMSFGARVMTMSDSSGVLVFPDGMTQEDWDVIIKAKQVDRIRLSDIEKTKITGIYIANESPWTIDLNQLNKKEDDDFDDDDDDSIITYAFPCATQNEITKESALHLIQTYNLGGVFEGANLPVTLDGQQVLRDYSAASDSTSEDGGGNDAAFIYIPGKAANAGGVGVSGFEMSQNAQHSKWSREKVDEMLQELMLNIYNQLVEGGGNGSLEDGANRAGFLKVVDAMSSIGWC